MSHKKLQNKKEENILIREMKFEDFLQVFNLGEKLFSARKWTSLYRTWDEYELMEYFMSDGEYCLVAEIGGRVKAFVLGTLLEKRRSAWSYGYVAWIGVGSNLSRKGVGKKLLNKLTELFIRDGARMMLADTAHNNKVAIDFFRRNGFDKETKHVYLSKNLTKHPKYLRKSKKRAC